MEKPKNLKSMLVFLVLTVLAVGAGIAAGVWDSLENVTAFNFNLKNVIGILVLIFATILVEQVLVYVLSLIKIGSNRANTILTVTSNLLKYVAAIVIVCGVLALMGVDIVTIVAGLGVIALIIGFGAESLIGDVVTGMFILLDNQYNVGDIIEVGGFRGTVTEIGIRTTCIEDVGGNVKIVNNSEMKNILNRSDNVSRAVTDFPVPYATDLAALEDRIPDMCRAIAAKYPEVFLGVPKYVGVQELAGSSVNLRFVADVAEKDIFNGARLLNRELLIRMREAGVECPFTQIDVHAN